MCEFITAYLKEIKDITGPLATIKAPISEEDQVVNLLGSLPNNYSSLVTVLETNRNLILDHVKQALINEEQ